MSGIDSALSLVSIDLEYIMNPPPGCFTPDVGSKCGIPNPDCAPLLAAPDSETVRPRTAIAVINLLPASK
jgi:hypothetical protein